MIVYFKALEQKLLIYLKESFFKGSAIKSLVSAPSAVPKYTERPSKDEAMHFNSVWIT